jgi:hypothetical protein
MMASRIDIRFVSVAKTQLARRARPHRMGA